MTVRASFVDLPVELCERIILLAARLYALDDRATLANLSRTSRAIHALVQPIQVETVSLKSPSLAHICAAPHLFLSTRCLLAGELPADEDRARLQSVVKSSNAFSNVELFHGPLLVLDAILCVCRPVRVIATSGRLTDSPQMAASFSGLTHLRGVRPAFFLQFFRTNGDESCRLLSQLSHVIIDSRIHFTDTLIALLSRLLELPKLERICLWSPARDSDILYLVFEVLLEFARARHETRLWLHQAIGHPVSTSSDPSSLFDDEHWLFGERFIS
ncbi:hypothetical protein EXIGLDRAFT_838334 [Exidia glandulosa HHB12029]|uniref:F-box domain-containing protein n=1 Tax=Exidia glandulosa HHB12029 TaxID=1314781 RepID=A0A165FXJ8_EXIGL|nr:hypothetical protein EXIGLDRAFT_838334 [Exidia glandulosa HHB12029]